LRQVALIALLAQIGSFVPASRARLGVVDRIFARVGAQDDLAGHRSTFMVEMIETANILRSATPRSLLILDEIGRGTSTFDGIAVARAVVEHIHGDPGLGCKTLFATHYHELAELEARLEKAAAFRMEVLERGEQVVFLHRVVPGAADRSYGVHVARLAGVPVAVTRRAAQILTELEALESARASNGVAASPRPSEHISPSGRLVIQRLAQTEPHELTPIQALAMLDELVDLVRNDAEHADR
jgi:DNA mismatch repair protein MutS